jgi:hypothetical protein
LEGTGDVAQAVKCLLCKGETLNPSSTKKIKIRGRVLIGLFADMNKLTSFSSLCKELILPV